ncbi:NAD(P)/FAD-dependent oxidoreductase [Natranaerobius trueperi]|uniref:NAD(P)/FAD-dependent oxidoreductase n=1 Tax=Natranaerobius trueperi TaxID=759412 RepID=A0A226BYR6_9FIRM|nr:FAD-dependent oxidoreductase [Natranaerobius trueperi]OWZ83280.1 hypothetical protein CDO51_09480 [Natranaerobius trueperi]
MHYVIVGDGIAGITAAKRLRELDKKSRISIYSNESFYCYSRPQLIEVLGNRLGIEDIPLKPVNWFYENDIELYLNVIVKNLDVDNKKIVTDCDQKIFFDKLLLATGSSPNTPPIKGIEQAGVFTIRKIEDVRRIQKNARDKTRSVVIGGGLLGLETAYSLKQLGLDVKVVDRNPWVLKKQIDMKGSNILKESIEEFGIEIILDSQTENITRDSLGNLKLVLTNGKEIETDLVVVSAGVIPNTVLASSAGIETNKGILVDDYLSTSALDVFAAGDVAEANGKCYGIIPAAIEQGKLVAENMVYINSKKYNGTVSSTSLKILGIDLVSIGEIYPSENDNVVAQVDFQNNIYKKTVFRDNVLIGAILLGDKTALPSLNKLIRTKTEVDNPEMIFN